MAQHNLPLPSNDPDQPLIHAMAAGNMRALDELYARHGLHILSYLMIHLGDRPLAEEILQDVILAAWNHAADFRGESRVLTWLLAIARNRALNAVRGRKIMMTPLNDDFEIASPDTGPLEKVVRLTEHASLRAALNRLPDQQREILTLVFFHQLSGPEIAQMLNISEGTVKSRLHRAKEALRRIMQSEGSL